MRLVTSEKTGFEVKGRWL